MNQIITLLQNLFSLTKVAAVTLPGLLSAGALALILWPATPVDLIPVATAGSRPSEDLGADQSCSGESALPRPNAYLEVCRMEFVPIDQFPTYIDSRLKRLLALGEVNKPKAAIQKGECESQTNESETDESLTVSFESKKPWRVAPFEFGLDRTLHCQLSAITSDLSVPESRRDQVKEQLILDAEDQMFSYCNEMENSLKGREESENLQLKADLEIEEKKRGAAQDNFLAALKSGSPVYGDYWRQMNSFQGCIALKRYTTIENEQDSRERQRRVEELTRTQQVIKARLADPGRLRPRLGFDAFMTGLVNHVVAFILLSLASAIIVTATDRAVFGAFFEDLFDGF
jgi:hypothetical protein